jgi:hypothetical protein
MLADLHFFLPVLLGFTFTDCAVDEPAQTTGLKFPGRASVPAGGGTFFNYPTGFCPALFFVHPRQEKKHLSFNMGRNRPPTLFITANGLDRGAKELRQLFLGLAKYFSDM